MSPITNGNAHSSSWGAKTTATEVGKVFASEIKGRNVIVTGPSPTSIGSETARVAAANGANLVVLVGRDPTKLETTAKRILTENPTAKIRNLTMDLTDLSSVREAAEKLISWGEKFHVVINNAGIMAPGYRKTVDGFESQFAANHLGHFLFVGLLLNSNIIVPFSPSHPARIINVTSVGHRYGHIRFEDPNFSDGKTYDEWKGYGQGKTANMLFSVELSKRGKGKDLVAYSVHPGSVTTNIGSALTPETIKSSNLPSDPASGNLTLKFKNLDQGAATQIVAAFSPSILSHPGSYLDDCQISFPSETDPAKEDPDYGFDFGADPHTPAHRALDEKEAERLWKLSEELVGEKINF